MQLRDRMWLGLLASHEYNLESCENKSLKLNIYLSSIFTYNVYDLCIHAGYLSPKVQRYNFKYNFKINQLKPVQAVTGRKKSMWRQLPFLPSLKILLNPAISKLQGKRKRKFEIAGFRNNWGSVKFVRMNHIVQYDKRHWLW